MAESEKAAGIRHRIDQTKTAMGALMEKRGAMVGRTGESYLHHEYGFDSRGPFMVRYLYLAAKLVTLYLAEAFTGTFRGRKPDPD